MPLLAARVRTANPARRVVRVLAGRKEKQAAAVEQKKATAEQAAVAVDAEGYPIPPAGAMMYPPPSAGCAADLNRDPRVRSRRGLCYWGVGGCIGTALLHRSPHSHLTTPSLRLPPPLLLPGRFLLRSPLFEG